MTSPDSEDQTVIATRAVLDRITTDGSPRVLVIVVTWNSADHIADCLDSLAAGSVKVAILVVDNGSTDDTVGVIDTRAEADVVVVRTGENLGYAGGNNRGLSVGVAAKADIAVVVNPDATTDASCIARLVEVLDSDRTIGLASPAICYEESDLIWYGGSDIDRRSGSTYHLHEGEPLADLPDAPYDTGRANGCVLALVPGRLAPIGMLDERYFLYYEEADWSVRVREHDLRVVVVPTAVAWHDVGHGSGGATPTYQYYMTRNRLLFSSAHGTHGALGAVPGTVRDSLVTLFALVRHNRRALGPCALAMLAGYVDFVRGHFGKRAE